MYGEWRSLDDTAVQSRNENVSTMLLLLDQNFAAQTFTFTLPQ
jgi:hypothetical protein